MSNPNMIVNAKMLKYFLLKVSPSAMSLEEREEHAKLLDACTDAENSKLLVAAHEHRHGTDVLLVRDHCTVEHPSIRARLMTLDPQTFEFDRDDEYLSTDAVTALVYDIRDVEPHKDVFNH